MKRTKTKLGISLVTLIITVFMLLGSTYAWFTDSVSNTGNKIQAGILDIDLLKKQDDGEYKSIGNDVEPAFDYDKWEPGYSDGGVFQIANNGNLALKYELQIALANGEIETFTVGNETKSLADVIDVYFLESDDDIAFPESFDAVKTQLTKVGTLANILDSNTVFAKGVLLPANAEGEVPETYASQVRNEKTYVAIILHMQEEAGNEYQNKTIGASFDIRLVATQFTYEKDGFDSNMYDEQTVYPIVNTAIKKISGVVSEDQILIVTGDLKSATVSSSGVNGVFNDMKSNNADSNELTLSLNVEKIAEKVMAEDDNKTTTKVDLEIDMSATMVSSVSGVSTATTKDVESLDSYTTIEYNLGKGLNNVTVTHNGNAMIKSNDTSNDAGQGIYSYDSETGVLTIKTKTFSPFAVTYDTAKPEVSIAKTGEETVYTTLADFRNRVNGGNSYAGYTVTLLKDVNLENAEWTPIGTSSNPFSGIFDGNNKTISNYVIKSSADNQGLFGYIEGIENSNYNVDNIWNYDSKTFSDECIDESNYTAVIKNLKISGVNVNVSSSGEATGGLIGKTKYAYISNIQMLSGTVKGYKQVGGVAGYIESSIICGCSNTGNFNVALNDICQYTVAGIVGTTRVKNCAVINCTNNANITGKGSTCMAGVVGQMTSSDSIIYGCTNNGDVTGSCESIATSESNCICGIAGQNAGAKYVVNCFNTGTISNTAGTYGQISGIGGYRGGIFYNCSNSGEITGKALYVAGISGGHSGNTNVTTLENCSNTGSLSNTYDGNRIASYIGTSATVILKDMTLNTPDDLNTAIYSLTGANLLELDNVHFSNGSTWNYSVVKSLNVKINDNCDKLAIVIGNVNNKVGIEGNGLTITIPETSTLTELIIKGNNATLTNNGTITAGLVFGEDSQNETITNLGSIDVVTIKGSSNIFNNGDTQHTTSSVSKYIGCNAQNTIINNYGKIGEDANTPGYNVMSFDSASGSVVNNYGIIYGRGNNANYAIGMKESNTITFNLYSGSKLIKRDGGWLIRSGATDMTFNINWATGTIFNSENGEALNEDAVNSISSVYEAGTTCTLTINKTKTN